MLWRGHLNRRKVRSVANQSKTLETIFNPERTGRNKNKKRNSHRRDGRQEGSICNKQVEGREENRTLELRPQYRRKGAGVGRKHESCHRTTQRKCFKCLCCRKVGSGWPVTVLPLALGPEFKSHIGLKSRADSAIALPLCVKKIKSTSEKRSIKERREKLSCA